MLIAFMPFTLEQRFFDIAYAAYASRRDAIYMLFTRCRRRQRVSPRRRAVSSRHNMLLMLMPLRRCFRAPVYD